MIDNPDQYVQEVAATLLAMQAGGSPEVSIDQYVQEAAVTLFALQAGASPEVNSGGFPILPEALELDNLPPVRRSPRLAARAAVNEPPSS
ncbi:hypothetical protein SLE2022_396880 [Rubroshorea leprosula]